MDDFLVRDKAVTFVGQHTPAVAVQPSVQGVEISHVAQTHRDRSVPSAFAKRGQRNRYQRFGKRAIDLLLVLAGAPVVLPIVLLCAVALWIESGNPFYKQRRLGRSGRVFSILKLRTMVRNADTMLEFHLDADPELKEEWETTQKLKSDPRITPVGRFLRVTSLDELPQIWNVLIGDMSLVGPRPMMPDQLDMYGAPDAYFAMRPGITGKWQVSARNESGFCARQNIDRDYYSRLSFQEDLRILHRTVGVVLRGTGY